MVDTVLPIANGCYVSDSLPVSAQCCINWYPHINEAPALNQEVLFGTPGIEELEFAGGRADSVIRGITAYRGEVFFVSGSELFKISYYEGTRYRTFVNPSTPITGTARVVFAANSEQLMVLVPGGDGYIVTPGLYPSISPTCTEITDADFTANGAPQYLAFIDGYFVCTTDEGGKFIISALNDGLAWNALDFGTAESSPDAAMVPIVYKNQLFIIGETTCEQFANTPNGAGFPFVRTGLFLDKGTASPYSAVVSADTFMFIGSGVNETPSVWALDGNSLTKISTSPIDSILQRLTSDEISAIYAWTYAMAGHFFVGFMLPDTTIVFDVTTKRWHERQSRIASDGDYITTACRINGFATSGTDLYASDTQDGRIGLYSADIYDEYGEPIVRTVTTQPFQNNMQPFFVPKLELTLESGVGLLEGEDNEVNPSVRMQISRDGGKTWGNERQRPIGAMGEYDCRAVWRRNGRSKRFDVYKFIMSDPVKPVAIQLTAQIEGRDDAAA